MRIKYQAKELLEKYDGLFTSKQAFSEGITSSILSRMVKVQLLERVGPGIYMDPNIFEDEFFVAQLRLRKGIFYKETALHLYNMTDRTPNYMEMNFPRGYKSNFFDDLRIKPYRQIKSLYNLGIKTIQTPYGNQVRTYNLERTLCDIVRSPHEAQKEIIGAAFRTYVERNDRDLNKLLYYAKELKVERKIKTYLGVLL